LEGIKILDLSRLMPFEYCTLLLADMGAEVLKIEEPGRGDYMRWLPPKMREENAAFLLLNRNKKSMTLNLKKKEGQDILRKLVRDNDVLFESYRPGVMSRMGLGYKELKEVNPKLIYCSATGYGQSGPYKDRPGHDINYISIAGILGVTGRHTGAPVIPGIPIADMSVGAFSALAILAALIAREKSGEGQFIDISMTDVALSQNVINLAMHLAGGKEMMDLTGKEPYYNIYETRDGKYVSLGNIEERFWENFCEGVGRPDLIEHHSSKGKEKERVAKELREVMLGKTRDEWVNQMKDKDVCIAPVYSIEEVLGDPHLIHREMFAEVDHPVEGRIKQISFPIKFSNTPAEIRSPPPALGEHTSEILRKMGYDKKGLERLESDGVI